MWMPATEIVGRIISFLSAAQPRPGRGKRCSSCWGRDYFQITHVQQSFGETLSQNGCVKAIFSKLVSWKVLQWNNDLSKYYYIPRRRSVQESLSCLSPHETKQQSGGGRFVIVSLDLCRLNVHFPFRRGPSSRLFEACGRDVLSATKPVGVAHSLFWL